MLIFSAIVPHPPIIIPEIGGENLKQVKKTVLAMQSLNKIFVQKEPEVVFLISPHTIVSGEEFNILTDFDLSGSLEQFGASEIQLSFGGEPELAKKIQEKARKEDISVNLSRFFELDHGSLVPLYYLSQGYDRFHLLIASFAAASLEDHFQYGRVVGQVIKSYKKRVAIVASGDLSHCLSPTAPAGYSPAGKEFDQKIVDLLKRNDAKGILDLDKSLIDKASECGLRSIIILLGALSEHQYSPKVLSYEGPFGVGYLVIHFQLSG